MKMNFLTSIKLAFLLMLFATSASAQVYYDMPKMANQSGYRSQIYETVTTADFLRAPANGVQRLAFTRGSAFIATVYACETKTPTDPATAGTCTSVATLSATNPSILVTTGRAWLVVDVTAAETAGNVSYLTIRSHSTQQLSGGSAGVDNSNLYFHGATGDGVTDDRAVLQAEIDRIGALPLADRVLYLPPGNFVIGDKNGDTGEFHTGALHLGQFDGFRLIGAGRDITNLIAGSDQGQNIISICDLNGGINCSTGTTVTNDTYISDLSFVDLDPIASGGQNAIVVTASAHTGSGTPTYFETVSWASGSGQLVEVGSSLGAGPRYVFSSSLVSGVLPAVGETLSGLNWTATDVSLTRGNAVEGSHGFNTKYVTGLTAERIGCRNLSDECIDIQYPSVNITLSDIHSTGVGSVNEGGSTISISGADGVYLDNFYIDTGNADISGSTSAIDIATNDQTVGLEGISEVTKNVFIKNGTIVDTSTTTGGQASMGVKLSVQRATASLINVNFDNVRINRDFLGVKAIKLNGIAGNGNGNVTFRDSHISGTLLGFGQPTFVTSWFINNRLDARNTGINGGSSINANYVGNSFYYPGASLHINFIFADITPIIIRDNTFHEGVVNDCIVSGGSLALITNNRFYKCGESGLTYAVQMNSDSRNNTITDNIIFDARSATLGFRAGDGTGAGCVVDPSSVTPRNVCDRNIVYTP